MEHEIETMPLAGDTAVDSVRAEFNSALSDSMELHRAKKLRGSVSFAGDAHQAIYACALAALAGEPVRLGNLPATRTAAGDVTVFGEYRAALEALGVVFEAVSETVEGTQQWLVRGGSWITPDEPIVVRHDLAALVLAGLCSGRALSVTVRPDLSFVSGDTIALLNALWSKSTTPENSASDDILIGTLNPKARGLVKPYERKWDESAAKIALLFHHVAAGESLELHLRRQGTDLLENLFVHFETGLKVERDDDKDADELTRRIARQMRAAGKDIPVTRLKLSAGSRPAPVFLTLAGDVTEASAVALAATLVKGSDVSFEHVLLNTGRGAFLAALRRMGADIEVTQRRDRFGETQGTIRVRTSELFAKRFDADTLADMRDEVFLLVAAATYAEGESVFRNLDWLRQGPIDRLREFTAALKRGGVETGEIEDGIVIRGRSESDGAAFDALGHAGLAAACTVMALKSHGSSTLIGADVLAQRHPDLLLHLAVLENSASGPTHEKHDKHEKHQMDDSQEKST